MSIEHVLFDADDVLQEVPGGWVESLRPWLGERAEEFLERQWSVENPALRGEADYLELLAEGLREFGVEASAADVFPLVWHSIELAEESLDVVRGVAAAGYGVHLGTNQEAHRAAYMRSSLGFDELFDVSVYSCDIGVAKPDPAYFTRAAELIGADPERVLFIDDRATNVAGAQDAGLHAERWELALGTDALRRLLAAHGMRLG